MPTKFLLAIALWLPARFLFAGEPPRITLLSYLPPGAYQYSDVPLALGATGTPPLHYQWRYNSQELPGQTNNSILLKNVQPLADPDTGLGPGALEGQYDVVITNSFGSTTNEVPWQLTVTPVPRLLSVSVTESNATLTWRGGRPPFTVQAATALSSEIWQDIAPAQSDTNAILPLTWSPAFWRVVGRGDL